MNSQWSNAVNIFGMVKLCFAAGAASTLEKVKAPTRGRHWSLSAPVGSKPGLSWFIELSCYNNLYPTYWDLYYLQTANSFFFFKLCAGYIWQQVQRIMNDWYHVQHGSKYHIECGRMPCSGSYGVKKTAALCQWKRASLLEMLSSLVC